MLLVIKTCSFSCPKNARGRKDRDVHSNRCTRYGKLWIIYVAVKAEMNLRVRTYSVGRGGTGVSSPEKNRFLYRLWCVFGTFSVSVNYYTCTKLSHNRRVENASFFEPECFCGSSLNAG